MVKRMLIDATHSEETRVVVVSGNRLEEFDFETSTKKQLKGNIYLAKVTRVEPSLQAAFVDYGGNRHGFLAFSEIHPDYYRIPIEDRQALLAESAKEAAADAAAEEADDEEEAAGGASEDAASADAQAEGEDDAKSAAAESEASGDAEDEDEDEAEEAVTVEAENGGKKVETLGGDDEEEIQSRNRRFQRRYRIQEVISRRQILLVQVTKEERGNKGAALTTYISLAGRYCVLMPNTPRGGGISRKISNAADRKKLKSIVEELDIPPGMAVIVRTAGSKRTKAEIRRDYDFLIRLWDEIRETTLKSTAPALVYEEANLIKRSLRDVYSKDIDEIFVEGDEGYKAAKAFMKQLIPSHAKRVQAYTDTSIPLFHRYQVESQLDSIHSPTVQLKSGGYIVMNSTEALVAIDVNSGKSTRERNIEETAYRTNLEAAEEIARQLRLRDLAGLIVIDFIDMEESRNRHNVERKLKEAMRNDRARIQLGRISPFGLLELSRQRLRPSILEASAQPCPTCAGTGVIRSVESTALHVLRAIEEEGMRQRSARLTIYVPTAVAFYILNQKRAGLGAIEERYGFEIYVEHDDNLIPPDYRLEREAVREGEEEEAPREREREREHERPRAEARREGSDRERERDRDRGRRRGRRRRDDEEEVERPEPREEVEAASVEEREDRRPEREEDDDQTPREAKGRRRGRRGGRRRRRGRERDGETGTELTEGAEDQPDEMAAAEDTAAAPSDATHEAPAEAEAETGEVEAGEPVADEATAEEPVAADVAPEDAEAKPKRRSRSRRKPAEKAPKAEVEAAAEADADAATEEAEAPVKKPRRRRAAKAQATGKAADVTVDEATPAKAETPRAAAPKAEAPEAKAAGSETPEPEELPVEAKPAEEKPVEDKSAAAGSNGATRHEAAEPATEAMVADAAEAEATSGETPPEPQAEDEKPKKRRRGWWSLGG